MRCRKPKSFLSQLMKKNSKQSPLIVLVNILGLLIFSNACFVDLAKNKLKSVRAEHQSIDSVGKFNEQLNFKKFKEICDDTVDEFKEAISDKGCLRYFEEVNKNLGKRIQSVLEHAVPAPDGNLVSLIYDVDFESGKGYEEFVYQTSGNYPKLQSYSVYTDKFNSSSLYKSLTQSPLR